MSEQPAPYNAANEAHVKGRKRREDRERLKREEAERFVMGDERGRLFVWWVLSECGMFRECFTGNSNTFHLLGKRSIGLQLTTELEKNTPDEFLQMWNEHLNEKKRNEKEDEAMRTKPTAAGNEEAKTESGET